MTRVGLVLRPELPPEVIAEAARHADRSGINEVRLREDCCHGAFAIPAAVLTTTDHVECRHRRSADTAA
ncbi:hypothetical protein HQ305_16865 [Rhodococcus sp. BP-149]|uniref:hypothetical protein n=1 Tax=unclassified Rhodococcus (in: high G+C Gram-positive bacteria) TaxID=192944 RepID=UPI001C9BA17D|nr:MULTISPECIES: hypothetical protein [unclassified Rhodococcus (in: high G+C Gram-positive bacteria)]MBY6687233.1 hypothetical protein [Rhodococcus sp. BP-288]MBY6694344.1 hypothetical protein [Rhodococcus sp. BP-188]MBY6698053.1 hypothetical protein [Rhodococcus sp. BP-285]MBY6704273.1 hypothetical protein [Rhodococcus sp. BP-283]MBY6712922.1 hypothetical protein [Rhodococcus sp. BP-160]